MKVIAYRSQSEANADEMVQWLFQWAYNHGWAIVITLAAVALCIAIITRRR